MRQIRKVVSSLLEFEMRQTGCRRLYFIPTSQIPNASSCCVAGMVSAGLTDLFRPQLRREWRGRGPTMILNDSIDRGANFDDWFRDLLATAIHESVHFLQILRHWKTPVPHVADRRQELRKTVTDDLANADHSLDPVIFPRWWFHDWKFLRAAFHARHRASERHQVTVPLNVLVQFDAYDYSSPMTYLDAIGDEVRQLEAVPLSQLDLIPAPAKFLQKWADDTGRDPAESMWPAGKPSWAA